MAALDLPSTACYEVHENIHVDTSDNEDHTFCGIMFPIEAKNDLPVCRLVIHSVSVRGQLGHLTVWVTKEEEDVANPYGSTAYSLQRIRNDASAWTKVYDKFHSPSRRRYETLDLSKNPIILEPGKTRAIYIHSAAQHDLAIVYDNSNSMRSARYSDSFLTIHSGAAHLSPERFDNQNIWGWGIGWRDYREFVGQINFGVVYQLWTPDMHRRFGNQFQEVTATILACQRRAESPVSMLPDECIYYILNMCRWDWFDDTADQLGVQQCKRLKKAERVKRASARAEQSRSREQRASRRWRSSFAGVREKILGAFS